MAFGAVEGEQGENSIIAVDDVVLLQKTCPVIGTCSFEDGFCDWTNTKTGDTSEWVMNQGSTPTEGTGPRYDHTLGTALGECCCCCKTLVHWWLMYHITHS